MVTSGAVRAGRECAFKIDLDGHLDKKLLAALGSRYLLNMWGSAFEQYGYGVAQVWVTNTNLQNPMECASIRAVIDSCAQLRVVPLINENDVISDDEIKLMDAGISENDNLARYIARVVDAKAILFLTEVGGVFDKDPLLFKNARKYQSISHAVFADSNPVSTSSGGSGGLKTKLDAAFGSHNDGMRVAIAGPAENEVVIRFMKGKRVGTVVGDKTEFYHEKHRYATYRK